MGTLQSFLIARRQAFSVAEALVEPGKETGAHWHPGSQEIYYILEGTGSMRLGEKTADVVCGRRRVDHARHRTPDKKYGRK